MKLTDDQIKKLPIISVKKWKSVYQKIQDAIPEHMCSICLIPHKGKILCSVQEQGDSDQGFFNEEVGEVMYENNNIGAPLFFIINAKYPNW